MTYSCSWLCTLLYRPSWTVVHTQPFPLYFTTVSVLQRSMRHTYNQCKYMSLPSTASVHPQLYTCTHLLLLIPSTLFHSSFRMSGNSGVSCGYTWPFHAWHIELHGSRDPESLYIRLGRCSSVISHSLPFPSLLHSYYIFPSWTLFVRVLLTTDFGWVLSCKLYYSVVHFAFQCFLDFSSILTNLVSSFFRLCTSSLHLWLFASVT